MGAHIPVWAAGRRGRRGRPQGTLLLPGEQPAVDRGPTSRTRLLRNVTPHPKDGTALMRGGGTTNTNKRVKLLDFIEEQGNATNIYTKSFYVSYGD